MSARRKKLKFLKWARRHRRPVSVLWLEQNNRGVIPKGFVHCENKNAFVFFCYTTRRRLNFTAYVQDPGDLFEMDHSIDALAYAIDWQIKRMYAVCKPPPDLIMISSDD